MERPTYTYHCYISWMVQENGEKEPVSWRRQADGLAYRRLTLEQRQLELQCLDSRREEFIIRAHETGFKWFDSMGVAVIANPEGVVEATILTQRTEDPEAQEYLLYDDLEWLAFCMGAQDKEFDALVE